MIKKQDYSYTILVILLIATVTSCSPAQQTIAPSIKPTVQVETFTPAQISLWPTLQATPSPVPSVTLTPTFIPLPSSTPTLTIVPSQTTSPTPTPSSLAIKPGMYTAGGCVITIQGHFEWCVVSFEVRNNGYMVVAVSWKLIKGCGDYCTVTKRSDVGNTAMYLRDEQGRRYRHVSVEGDAAKDIVMRKNTIYGSYVFPPALPGATTFSFQDENQEANIENLVLNQIVFTREILVLKWYPFSLEFRSDRWLPSLTSNGGKQISYKELPDCQIFELPPSKPQGSLINTIAIGDVTYKIYYRIDGDKLIREYLADSGLKELNPTNAPLIRLIMPASKEVSCVSYAGDVLLTLKPIKS